MEGATIEFLERAMAVTEHDAPVKGDQRISKYLFVAQLLRIIATDATPSDKPMYIG